MKKKYFLILFILSISLIGCKNITENKNENNYNKNYCNEKYPSNCNFNCTDDSDCIPTCPMGCINKNQNYEESKDKLCELIYCKCVDGFCKNSFSKN